MFSFVGSFFLNYLGWVNISRLIVATSVSICATIYHSYLIAADETPTTGLYNLQLANLLLPWLLFSWKERVWLFTAMTINLILFFSYPVTNAWFELPLDDTSFRSGTLGTMSQIIAVLTALSALFLINQLHEQTNTENDGLLKEMMAKQEKMQHAENRMKENILKLEEAQEMERQRSWASEGIAQCTKIIRAHSQSEQLYDQLIQFVVKYMKANQGALMVSKDDATEPYLQMVACYAYDRKKYLDKRIMAGEGITGQAFLEQDTIYLTEIPDNYINIRSGLGGTNPNAILVVPMKENEKVEGVLELASFHPFPKYQIEFIEKLGEVIASTIYNTRINELTQKLLDDSKIQTEQMRAQEEEMRQNMEELAATQEELQRKEREYICRIEELETKLNVEA